MGWMHYAAIGDADNFRVTRQIPFPFFPYSLPPSDDFSASKKRAIRINCRVNLEKRKRTICKIEYDIDFFEISPSPRKLFLSAEIGRKEDNNVGISFENRRRFEIRNRGCAEGEKEAADRVIDVPALAPTLARALTINYRDSIRN